VQGNVESDGLLRQASKHGVVFGLCSFNVTQGQARRRQRNKMQGLMVCNVRQANMVLCLACALSMSRRDKPGESSATRCRPDGMQRQTSKHGVVFGLCSFNVTQGQARRKQRNKMQGLMVCSVKQANMVLCLACALSMSRRDKPRESSAGRSG